MLHQVKLAIIKTFATSITFSMLMSCGESSDSIKKAKNQKPSEKKSLKKGVFLDSAVKGIGYRQEGQTSLKYTDAQGQFTYEAGKKVKFFLGKIQLGEIQGTAVVTPQTVIGATSPQDPEAINLMIVLQGLDADGDLTNGIELSDKVKNLDSQTKNKNWVDIAKTAIPTFQLEGHTIDLSNLNDLKKLVDPIKNKTPRLPDIKKALEHFKKNGLKKFLEFKAKSKPSSSSPTVTAQNITELGASSTE